MSIILKNGTVFLESKGGFFNCDIEIENQKIKKIGNNIKGDNEIDCTDKYVLPGLIDAHSHIGMWEAGLNWEGDDGNECTDPITPELRAIDSINPMDEAFREAIKGGVTVASTGPGSANVVGGQFVTMKLHGNVMDDMIVKFPASMKCAFGENPKGVYGKENKTPQTRMATAALLRKTLHDAKVYAEKKEYHLDEGKGPFETDFKMEALIPVIEKEIPLKAHAHRADDICTALRIAEEFDVRITLEHCTEGHLIADHIKKFGVCAQVGPTLTDKSKVELNKLTWDTAKVLTEKGVSVSIITDHPVIPQWHLNICAALAMKAGLSELDALKAITINPAKALEIDEIKGSIEEGKDADIVIWDGHPLNIQSSVEKVFIEGEEVYSIK